MYMDFVAPVLGMVRSEDTPLVLDACDTGGPSLWRSVGGRNLKGLPSGKLTWQWKTHQLKMYFLLENGYFPLPC